MTGFFSVFAVLGVLLMLACGIAILPALFVVGAAVLAFAIAIGVIGLVLRLIGWLFVLLLAVPLALGAFALVFALGIGLLHAALPLLVVVGIVWLIAHHHRSTLPRAS